MNFKEWRIWFTNLPWAMRWFAYLVLLRPLVDSFYQLKNISPFLSPLYIVGVLTPLLIIWSFTKLKRPKYSRMDTVFRFFTFFMTIGITFVILFDPFSKIGIEMGIKLSLPLLLYFYLRRFIRTKEDLDGLLQTFLYSCIIVGAILVYELIFGPVRVEESRGYERIQGFFGDVVSYGIYIAFSFLTVTYFYFSRKGKASFRVRTTNILIVATLCVLGLFNIYHVASYLTFGSILVLFFMFNMRADYNATFLFGVLIIAFFMVWGQELLQDRLVPLLSKDQEVLQGTAGIGSLGHGRVSRWIFMWDLYTRENVIIQFFGFPVAMSAPYNFVGSGAHNDFIRIMFLSGFMGIASYFGVLISAYRRALKSISSIKYLALGALGILFLYSMSITPTYYPHFMYLVMAIFAFVAIPKKENAA